MVQEVGAALKFTSIPNQMVEKGLDASWLKAKVALNNIANISTPGYKAKKVSFVESLQECKSPLHGGPKQTETYKAIVSYDKNTEARVDGNNVSLENEQLELWRAQAQYAYLNEKATRTYASLRNVIGQFGK